ncbi:lipase regulator 1 [Apiospora aurea]|uniref:Lipase regulator 1 n=1 Tax=Apiospora aurea TaxID=335848 RepID=A0ABR1QQH9_9PEZI
MNEGTMSNDPSVRRLLPQNSHLGQFAFAPQSFQQQPRETQKNYVFVDEHNRHKRLKVMRACEGCRRRKIKCDAATTNTWPCSACIRLKLHCVRPNGQYEGGPDSQAYEQSSTDYDQGFRQQMPMQQQPMMGGQPKVAMYGGQAPYAEAQDVYQSVPYGAHATAQPGMHYTTMAPATGVMDQSYAPSSVFPTPPMQHHAGPHSEPSPESSYTQDQYAQSDLADLLGSLKMDARGTAPYLNIKKSIKNLREEEPVVEDEPDDFCEALPSMPSVPGSKIRIPPELMPDEETILHYFDLYFANVHPYVPVLNKSQLMQQWQTDRQSISPLVLEAIFAVAGRLADEPAQGQQWIAMASRHADSFMDVPRLSTLQALLIILKAREAQPKRGYYYRSWVSIVNCITMAKDLGLDEHYEDHQAGRHCDETPAECVTKTRIWQTVFICELMIGSSQGRDDLTVYPETVDFSIPRHIPGGDDVEYHVTRNFTYFARCVRNVRQMNTVYRKIKRRKDWGLDPEFLTFLDPMGADGQWKNHMLLSYSSAKLLCRIEEAMLQSYGLSGLQCMQRGISFTIYAILTCIPIYLVALTSPDPEFSTDARDYFTRHMRIMEKTMGSWPIPEMVKQIEAVREAFSADTRKPFVLKPSFPYGSPSMSHQSTPPRASSFKPPMIRTSPMSIDQGMSSLPASQAQVSYINHPITPPVSAGPKSDSPAQSLVMMANGQTSQAPSHGISMTEAPAWNPSRIFDQWNSTFGAPELPNVQANPATPMSAGPHSIPPQQYSAAPVQTFVTPAMWQQSVASVYEGGMKRHYDA